MGEYMTMCDVAAEIAFEEREKEAILDYAAFLKFQKNYDSMANILAHDIPEPPPITIVVHQS